MKKIILREEQIRNLLGEISVGELTKLVKDVETNPSEAQIEVGNYKKGHVVINGFDITIENPKDSKRSGVDADGKPWETTMHNHYGYFKTTEGKDGDHIDLFIGSDLDSDKIFVVDQVNEKGEFDEHKVMLGFTNKTEAKKAYLSNYMRGWKGLKDITEVSVDDFKVWLYSGKKRIKGFADYKLIN